MARSHRMVYQQGDHICTLFSSPQEQLIAAIEYIQGGLGRGERCLYICCEHSVRKFRAALRKAGIDVAREVKRGALQIVTKEQAHLKGGRFEVDAMISMLEAAVKDALDAGFDGLCAAGDMTWVLEEAPGTEHLAQYEAKLNDFYASHRALGLCQYSRKSLPAAMLDHGIATHRYIRMDDAILLENPFYEDPEAAARRTADEKGVTEKLHAIDQRRSA